MTGHRDRIDRSSIRRVIVAVIALIVALTPVGAPGGSPLGPLAAAAETVDVSDVQFRWGINNESNNRGAAPGTFNFFSAGMLGDPGAGGQLLSNSDNGWTWSNGAVAGWAASSGNVSIEKRQPDDTYELATWGGTKTDKAGVSLGPYATSTAFSDHQVVIDDGAGTLDASADNADISWRGDFTVVYYSGYTFFYVSDPHLVVEGGSGSLVATVSGYGSDMDNATTWVTLEPTEVTLATLSGVDVTTTGLVATPAYAGVAYDAPPGATVQDRSGAHFGSFPTDFADFQQLTGQGAYWYSSGGAIDKNKPALPLFVSADPVEAPEDAPSITTHPVSTSAVAGSEVVLSVAATGSALEYRWQRLTGPTWVDVPGADVASLVLADVAAEDAGPYRVRVSNDVGSVTSSAATLLVAPRPSTLAISAPASGTYGSRVQVQVSVPDRSGTVRLTGAGSAQIAPMANGAAMFTLPATLGAGLYDLRAAYAGDSGHAAADAVHRLTIHRAAVAFAPLRVTKQPTTRRAGSVRLTLRTSTAAVVNGTVTVTLRKDRVAKRARAVLRGGTTVIRLPRLGRGTWKLVATYPESSNFGARTATRSVRVRR
jgi:hypothetical protein